MASGLKLFTNLTPTMTTRGLTAVVSLAKSKAASGVEMAASPTFHPSPFNSKGTGRRTLNELVVFLGNSLVGSLTNTIRFMPGNATSLASLPLGSRSTTRRSSRPLPLPQSPPCLRAPGDTARVPVPSRWARLYRAGLARNW